MSIASNEAHVSDRIESGDLQPDARWQEVARLYRCQLSAKQREWVAMRARAEAAEAKLREIGP